MRGKTNGVSWVGGVLRVAAWPLRRGQQRLKASHVSEVETVRNCSIQYRFQAFVRALFLMWHPLE